MNSKKSRTSSTKESETCSISRISCSLAVIGYLSQYQTTSFITLTGFQGRLHRQSSEKGDRFLARKFEGIFNTGDSTDSASKQEILATPNQRKTVFQPEFLED